MKKITISSLFFVFLLPINQTTYAQTCWDMAGKKYNVDAWLLLSIAAVESTFQSGISSQNKNATTDLGLMQINTIHIPMFQRMGISSHQLQYNDCINVFAAAYLLRQSINRYGLNIDGLGGYHSNTPKLRRNYGAKLLKKYQELTHFYFVQGNTFSFESYRKNFLKRKKATQLTQNNHSPTNLSSNKLANQSALPSTHHNRTTKWTFKRNNAMVPK